VADAGTERRRDVKQVGVGIVLGLVALAVFGLVPLSAEGEALQQEPTVLREWDVFDKVQRDANVVYNSATVQVNEGDRVARFSIVDFDLVNEPSSTVIYFKMERSADGGKSWAPMVAVNIPGMDGRQPPKPPGTVSTTVDGIPGQLIRGTFYFDSDGARTKKFRVEGKMLE
jgi:hypothetical protein